MSLSRKTLLLLPVLLFYVAAAAWAEDRWNDWWSCDEPVPMGSRQRCHNGKQWPIDPRPTGKCEPLVNRYYNAHYWPDPFRWEDRSAVRQHLAAQRDSGWITATTLYEQHFDPLTNQINEGGKVHLQWIVLHAPPSKRMTWVQAGQNPNISKTRLVSAQEEATLLAGNGAPPVMLRVCQSTGTSAQEMDLVRRSFLATIPVPRINYVPLGAGGDGAGGGAPGGAGSPPPR